MPVLTFVVICCAFNFGLTYDISSRQLSYLQDFGYFERPKADARDLATQESVKEAVKKFQKFMGIPVSGVIDDATLKMFSQPRCGLKDLNDGNDVENKSKKRRQRRFATKGLRWQGKVLTYQIENWTNDLSRIAVAKAIKKALGKWQAVSNLEFRYQRHGRADIMIKFARRTHGDAYNFDGPGGTLAHAFFPGNQQLAGDTHFDDDEVFTLGTPRGKNFDWVALHEFGHAIGLDHNRIKGAIMYPLYIGYRGNDIKLHDDDIKGIQYLYGVPENYQPRTIPPKQEYEEDSNGCIHNIQTITHNRDLNEVHVINGNKLYTYDDLVLTRKTKTSKLLKEYFKDENLDRIDAAYDLPDGHVVYLKADRSWEYKGNKLIRGNIEVKRRGFIDDMHDVDAAFYWSKARKVYIFKGEIYWRYNPWLRRVDHGYPKKIQDSWQGVPNHIDSVFEWKGKVFFFKGDKYYRFDVNRLMVLKGYPLYITNSFLICKPAPRVSQLVAMETKEDGVHVSSSIKINFIDLNILILPYLVMCLLFYL